MFRSFMKLLFILFLLLSGLFMGISAFVLFPADLWFVQGIWAFMGVCMLFCAGLVISHVVR